jgi:hypothetical protein
MELTPDFRLAIEKRASRHLDVLSASRQLAPSEAALRLRFSGKPVFVRVDWICKVLRLSGTDFSTA